MAVFECNRLQNRRSAITSAARQLFIEQGFERTTLGHVVERAGGSLATVYKLFGNKDGLLNAVVLESAASGESLVLEAAEAGLPPDEALHRIATGLKAHFLDPEVVALIRIVIARSVSDVDIARSFHEQTANRTREALLRLFEHWAGQGHAMNGSPDLLTDCFLGMLFSDVYRVAITHNTAHSLSDNDFTARTNLFLLGAGIAPRA